MASKLKKAVSSALRITLPVLAGYMFLGVTFGLVIKASGVSWWVPVFMSAVIFSGTSEFAAIPFLYAAFNPLHALLIGITLSARYLFYGIPMLKKYENVGKIKPFLIFGLTDETFSILSSADVPEGVTPKHFYFLVTLFDFLYWNAGTALGVLLGGLNFNMEGLDFVLTALFVVLLLEQMKTKTGIKSGTIGLAVSAFSLLLFGSSNFVLAAMAILIAVLLLGRRFIDRE